MVKIIAGSDVAVSKRFITIINGNARLQVTNDLQFVITFPNNERTYQVTRVKNPTSSIYLSDSSNNRILFTRKTTHIEDITNEFGKGKIVKAEAISHDGAILSNISFGAYEKFPNTILVQATFKNISGKPYQVSSYALQIWLNPLMKENEWWSFQGASYYWGQDFAFKLPNTFSRENYMGLNDTRIGGGLPLIDVWNKYFGLALAYLGEKPRDIYLPVKKENGELDVQIRENNKGHFLNPNDSLVTIQTAIIPHKNDFYDPLQIYSGLMKPFLPDFKKPVDYAYQSEWCTWGYRRDFKPEQILSKLEHLKAMGIKSVILDDGWSVNHGDWIVDPAKFPNGEADFKHLIKKIHDEGFKVWLWWVPGYADSITRLAAEKPDWYVKNKDGSIHASYALCPGYPPVQEHFKKLVEKFVTEFKVDGFKLDFQEINYCSTLL